MNIIEAIKARRSVRNFNGKGLSPEQTEALSRAVDDSFSPFGGSVTIRLKKFNIKEGYRPGTYGMIRGAEDFFLIGIGEDEESALSAGFRFEQVVLQAWRLGLGTCWIAATFKDSDFNSGQSWPDNEELRIVCPVGEPLKPGVKEKLIRLSLRSASRKQPSELFFFGDFGHPVPQDNTFMESLEMLRLAPSSTNSQPWRALVIGDTVHFFSRTGSDISVIDCGIGLCHFFEAERFRGYEGSFHKDDSYPAPPREWRYIMSYRR